MKDERSWFAVRFLLESLHPEATDSPQFFEERIVVVQANDEDEAEEKAMGHARSEEHEYENALGNSVRVVFREILDVQQVLADEITDLTEVYSQFLNADEVDQVRRSLSPGSAEERRPADARR